MRSRHTKLLFGAILTGASVAPDVLANTAELQQERPLESQSDQTHLGHNTGGLEEIIVTAHPGARSRYDVLQGTSVLTGEDLEQAVRATIGDSLDRLPGLSQTAFGQGASRPVIRGLSGDRLRVLINDLGSFDASTTSPDHAVALDLSAAKRIEVVRGPATLIYGANAIAGVVNVTDNRVPRALPEDGKADGFIRSSYGTNADEVVNSGALDLNITGGWMAHLDGFYRNHRDFTAPGFLRSEQERLDDPLPEGEDEPFGRANNSGIESWGGTGGLSYVGDNGFIGASISHLDTVYGIPVALEGEEEEGGEEEEEGVRIDIEQLRVDVIGEWTKPFAIFEKASLRFGYGDYDQAELEGDEIGTLFLNEEWEARLDLTQKNRNGWSGTSGVHLRSRNFEAIGLEAFVPPNDTMQWGLYSYQSIETGAWHVDAGVRLDRQTVESVTRSIDRSFTGISLSAGVSYDLGAGYLIGANGFRTERAPNADELFSDGPHLASFTFERGDETLGEETAKGLELSLKKNSGPLTFILNGFYTAYDDFIFERFTGETEDNLPVAQFSATQARFYGLEMEADYLLWQSGERTIKLNAVFDVVEAKNRSDGTPLPRIPPLSVQLGADYQSHWFDIHISGEYAAKQNDIATFELPTDDYFVLGTTVSIHPFDGRDITLMIEGRNLTDSDIRYHTSFLKDLVPAPGRSIRFTLRAGF
ncbi:TonB-dependent receptor [Iodidimonas gelatinilytica]|uniref:TonB-dependent receptor n=1 Tax=Iodidimonas gelatinilytica TaxID=1236966 RepID=A0A5A7N2K0_9PROT|nr:TonB-dependent receptor [Iodidimonas gelatinilytica]GER01296.1 TonB-dependent receptor [Iodidimonas gelatinilytica]